MSRTLWLLKEFSPEGLMRWEWGSLRAPHPLTTTHFHSAPPLPTLPTSAPQVMPLVHCHIPVPLTPWLLVCFFNNDFIANSHTQKFTLSKCTISCFQCVHRVTQPSPLCNLQHHSRKKHILLSITPSPGNYQSTFHLYGLTSRNIPYTWTHTMCDLLWQASFTFQGLFRL